MTRETDLQADAAREGDADAFATLYERVAPALHTWAALRVRGRLERTTDPEDLLQEIWWNALQSFNSFDADRGSFRAWLFGVANHVFLGLMRRSFAPGGGEMRHGAASLPEDLKASLTSITSAAAKRESTRELLEAVRALPRDDQKLFVHCGLEGMTAKAAAPVLALPPETVKKRWQRLRARLETMKGWSTLFDLA